MAIETVGVPGVVLMENAGRNAADAIERFLGGSAGGKRVAVVAGAGNNGGDGFVVARHLAMRGGAVTIFLVTPPAKIAGDAATNLNILRNLGQEVVVMSEADGASLAGRLGGFDLVVDAIGGTGIQGPLRGTPAEAVRQVNAAGRPVVAIDIPTGLDCDTGEAHDPTIRAVLTVTFVARKKGFDAAGAAAWTGEVVVADIGVPPEIGKGANMSSSDRGDSTVEVPGVPRRTDPYRIHSLTVLALDLIVLAFVLLNGVMRIDAHRTIFADMGCNLPSLTKAILSVPTFVYWAVAFGLAAALVLKEFLICSAKSTLICNSIACLLLVVAWAILHMALTEPMSALLRSVQGY